ncbi:MAG: flagellar biosynthesis anti-sigma factor FlgM [Candidatus Marinimicrobia bacterium]|nr:flagellar biosynthesis anti-sigma factor FlgM [Candidatus Neomarinimicrobiota bacterium]MCF7880548.1 flagellar biosynthesis anti-sigma factor FlgM [Candidatus Neomarinimicrobiota bacterium]
MRIKDILTGSFQKTGRTKDKDGPRAVSPDQKSQSSDPVRKTDTTEISSEARELQQAAQLIQESVEILKSMPGIREDAVAMAKTRVESGYYDKPEVLHAVAGIIENHLTAESPVSSTDLATDIIANISPENADLTREDLQMIQENLEKGFYQNREVVEQVADRIYRFLGQVRSEE